MLCFVIKTWLRTVICLSASFACTSASAADAPQWKFEEGQSNRYRMNQTMNMSMVIGGNDVKNNIKQIIDMSWTVREIKDDGSALLDQKIDRMRMTIEAGGNKVEVDSAAKEEPQNQAAMLAPLLKAFTAKPFQVTMSPRGEITEVEVPEEMIEALKNTPGAAAMGDMATPEGFKKMVSQASFAMPEKLAPGDQWTQKMEMQLPGIGKQIAETTYKYEGAKEVEGKEYEVFTPSLKIRYEGGATAVDVGDQKSSGQILFDREAGRLEKSQLKQNMTLTLSAGGQAIEQQLEQTIEMQWMPEGENGEDQ
jgi:hypothetical protein